MRGVVALVDQAGEQPPGRDRLLAVQRRGGERTEQRLDDVDGVPGLPEVLAQEVGGPVRPAVEVAHRGQGPVRPRTSAGTRSAVARVRAVAVHACGPSCTNSVPSGETTHSVSRPGSQVTARPFDRGEHALGAEHLDAALVDHDRPPHRHAVVALGDLDPGGETL